VAPVRITIPAIDVAARVDELGLRKDRTVEVPDDPMRTGWYGLGPSPGQSGSAVILGHVDSTAGTAVFGRLRDLRPGNLVVVEAADGATSTFRVIRLVTYPNKDFPGEEVYAAAGPERRLNLVTCGGKYTRATGHQANLVVYTRLVQDA
jgi:sortase (surface protein transpeptidase)